MDDTAEDSRPLKRVKLEGNEAAPQNNRTSAAISNDNMKELEVGINTWIDESRPVFHGLLKKRYTDFLVNEILLDGTVAHLRDLRPKQSNDAVSVASTTTTGAPGHGDESKDVAPNGDKMMEPTASITRGDPPPVPGSGDSVAQSEGRPQAEGLKVSSPLIYHC
jgi:tRNA pseudouridine13 synthase